MPDTPPAPLPPAKTNTRSAWRVLRYLIAAAILALLFTQIEISKVWDALQQADARWIAAAAVASLLLQFVIAARLQWLTDAQGIDLSVGQLFEINLATMFYGLFLPGGNFAGLAVRFYRLGNRGKDIAGAGIALLIDRIVATLSLCAVGMVFWLLERPAGRDALVVFLVMAGGLVSMTLLCVAVAARWPMPAKLAKLTHKITQAAQKWRTMPRRAHTVVLLLGALAHVIGIVVFVCLAWAMRIDVGFVSLGWIRSAVILATMIPISVAGLGLREGAMIVMLKAYGIDESHAVAMSLLVFVFVMLLPGVIGGMFEIKRLVLTR